MDCTPGRLADPFHVHHGLVEIPGIQREDAGRGGQGADGVLELVRRDGADVA